MVEVKEKTNVVTGLGLLGMSLDIAVPQQVFTNIVPVYRPTEIVCEGKRYIFREPLQCQCEFTPDGGDDTYFIKYKPFGIWGAGETWKQAVDFFSFQFAAQYEHFTELGDEKIGNVYRNVLRLMQDMVTRIIPSNP
jgi:hypothetical protein